MAETRTAVCHRRGDLVHRLVRDTRGVGLIEFAVLLPVFVVLVFGVMQMGQLFWTQSALQHAVEMAARCASVNTTTCGTSPQIQTYAATQAYGLALPPAAFTASTPACGNLVVASYTYTFPIAALTLSSVDLTAQSCYPR
ncbi:MAG: TadE/TadG family type IV pilus assembly protein [Pseudomonadota bacterium]